MQIWKIFASKQQEMVYLVFSETGYDAYDPLLMLDKQTRNQIVVTSQTGRKQFLFRTSIIGKWHLIDDSYTTTLSIEHIVCSTLLQEYIPIKNATVYTFFILGDRLNEGTGNNCLINYLSNLYPNCSVLKMDPICSELKTNASIQNYNFICKQ